MTDDMWGAGDYQAVAQKVTSIAEVLVRRAHVESGMTVLDVACGTGNASIAAAELGARVTGLDFSPQLITIAREQGDRGECRRRVARRGCSIASIRRGQLRPGHLCDRAHVRADHRRTADELRRVCRNDGRIAIACWTPEGSIGAMFQRLGEISAPPPAGFQSPLLWGTEDHVRELLGDGVEFERHDVEFEEPSPESYADFMLTRFPPLVAMRAEHRRRDRPRDVSGLGRRRE